MVDFKINSGTFLVPLALSLTAMPAIDGEFISTPSQNYDLQISYEQPLFTTEFYTQTSASSDMTDLDKFMVIQDFTSQLIESTRDIPSEFAEVINRDFWDLI